MSNELEEENPLTLISAGIVFFGAAGPIILGWIATKSTATMTWLVEHNILATPAESILHLGDEGGLDLARIILLVILVVAVLAGLVAVLRAMNNARRRRTVRALDL